MSRLAIRLLMALIGVGVFVIYAGSGVLLYLLLASVWLDPSSRATALAAVVVATLLGGLLSYRFGTKGLIAGLDAVEVTPEDAPAVHRMLDALCERMDVVRPTVYVASLEAPNALAVGGIRSGALVIDPSLFRLLDAEQLEAILAHELAHLERWDGLVQTLAYATLRTVVGLALLVLLPLLLVVSGLARGVAWLRGTPGGWPATTARRLSLAVGRGVTVLLVGLTLVVRAHSRRREFAADDRAATVTGNPLALAEALTRIERAVDAPWSLLSPLYVVEDRNDPMTRWFSTHPSLEKRVERLQKRAEIDCQQPTLRRVR